MRSMENVFPLHPEWAELGREIARVRAAHNMSVREVAERSGLPVDAVRSAELGVAEGDDPAVPYDGPSAEILLRIAGAIGELGVSATRWIETARRIRSVRS